MLGSLTDRVPLEDAGSLLQMLLLVEHVLRDVVLPAPLLHAELGFPSPSAVP